MCIALMREFLRCGIDSEIRNAKLEFMNVENLNRYLRPETTILHPTPGECIYLTLRTLSPVPSLSFSLTPGTLCLLGVKGYLISFGLELGVSKISVMFTSEVVA